MRHFFISTLLVCSLFLTFTSCSHEQVMPIPPIDETNLRINQRSDFSGREAQVKVKVSQRDGIPINAILTCTYMGLTAEGYGRYHFTTNVAPGIYLVTAIIGDDIDGI